MNELIILNAMPDTAIMGPVYGELDRWEVGTLYEIAQLWGQGN
jgi:hypothetical protein